MNEVDLMKYKGYSGSIHFDANEEIFYGKVEFIRDLIIYEAREAKSLIKSFQEAIDNYLNDCEQLNKIPDKSFEGTFNAEITFELYK